MYNFVSRRDNILIVVVSSNEFKLILIYMKKIIALLTLTLLISTSLFAQQEVEMADKMREDGKIWVVVAVIAVVFLGIISYLVLLDRKISKIEKGL